jgi:hypothetical protein
MTATTHRLFDAIRGRTPCNGCRFSANCARGPMACSDYSHYVQTNEIRLSFRTPSRRQYSKIMRSEA